MIPHRSPGAQGPKQPKKIPQSEGLRRPVRNTGVSKVWDFAGGLCDSCDECRAPALCSLSPETGVPSFIPGLLTA